MCSNTLFCSVLSVYITALSALKVLLPFPSTRTIPFQILSYHPTVPFLILSTTHRWRAYDTNEGIEVAWNVVKLSRTPPSERKRIKTEVKLLKVIGYSSLRLTFHYRCIPLSISTAYLPVCIFLYVCCCACVRLCICVTVKHHRVTN
jgi:hypothetical protein